MDVNGRFELVVGDWLLATLSSTLAVVATLLAALGLYGVLSYMIARRVSRGVIRGSESPGRPSRMQSSLCEPRPNCCHRRQVLDGLKEFVGKGEVFRTSLDKDEEESLREALQKAA